MEQKSGISVHHSSAPTPTEQEEPTLSCAAIRGMKITTFMRLHYVPATAAEKRHKLAEQITAIKHGTRIRMEEQAWVWWQHIVEVLANHHSRDESECHFPLHIVWGFSLERKVFGGSWTQNCLNPYQLYHLFYVHMHTKYMFKKLPSQPQV